MSAKCFGLSSALSAQCTQVHCGHQNQVLQVLRVHKIAVTPDRYQPSSEAGEGRNGQETVFWKSIHVCHAKDMLIDFFRAYFGVIDGELVGPKAIIRSYWGSLQRKVGIWGKRVRTLHFECSLKPEHSVLSASQCSKISVHSVLSALRFLCFAHRSSHRLSSSSARPTRARPDSSSVRG